MRGRILIVISSPNPWHLDRLSESDRVRYRLLEEGTIRRWRAKGYEATDAGRGFVPEDYLDLQHFTESGGEKLAASLAPQIEAIANRPKASEAND